MSKKSQIPRKNQKLGLPPESLVYTGVREPVPAKVHAVRYNEHLFNALEDYCLPEEGNVLWLDVRNLHETELIAKIGAEFHIHPLALEDVLNTQQRPKLEEFENGLFFIVPHLKLDPVTLEFSPEQIAFFTGKNFTVSFQEDPDDTFDPVRKRIHDGIGRIRKKGADYLMYSLIDTIVDGYYSVLDTLENEVLAIEDTLYRNGAHLPAKAKIFKLKRLVNDFKHRVLPLREAVTRFYRAESELIDQSNRLYFRDLVDHVAQILDTLDNQRDLLANMEAYYQAEAANRLNNVMRLLTVISTIFIPLSFIAGVYGMNFDNMPELHTTYGYFILLGIMFCLMITMLVWFRVKKWI